jgi:hypothetical protein
MTASIMAVLRESALLLQQKIAGGSETSRQTARERSSFTVHYLSLAYRNSREE